MWFARLPIARFPLVSRELVSLEKADEVVAAALEADCEECAVASLPAFVLLLLEALRQL